MPPVVTPGSDPSSTPKTSGLDELREKIDQIDDELVRLLSARAQVVVEVGKSKHKSGAPIYAPHREAELLKRVLKKNPGPLPDRALEAIYRELMSGSFALEQPLRVGYLGPEGSFSHLASVSHFGSSVGLNGLSDIEGVFREVDRGHIDYGVVPIENSTGGSVSEAMDAFSNAQYQLSVYAEILVGVRHHLISNAPADQIRAIHSKPEAFQQCRDWLSAHYPNAELVPAPSSSHAVQHAALEKDAAMGAAAIGSDIAAQIYGMKILFSNIEDNPHNMTRFFILARQKAERSGQDKTSLMFTTENKPGALVQVLLEFQNAGINLTHIDKRPSRRQNWAYTFFVDAEGHQTDAPLSQAIEKAKAHCKEFVILGSYPKALRIL